MNLSIRTYKRSNTLGITWGRSSSERWLCVRLGNRGLRFGVQRALPAETIRIRYLIAGQW